MRSAARWFVAVVVVAHGLIHLLGVGQLLGGGGLEAGEPVHLGRPRRLGARAGAVH